MIVTDPIADMLTRIRNAITAKHDTVLVPASKEKLTIADILMKEGYIVSAEVEDSDSAQKFIKIVLKYILKRPCFFYHDSKRLKSPPERKGQ